VQPLSFFAWLLGTVVGLVCLAVVLGVAVDPYRVYGTAGVPRWTAVKPRIYNQASLAKTYQLERVGPRTLLLGNSRVEIGLDPESSRWPAEAHPVFNAALAGTNLRTSLDMLRDAFAAHAPQTVLLGLDFLDFLQMPDSLPAPPAPVGPDERRLLVDRNGKPNPERPLQVWRDRIATTLTIDAVVDDLATLVDQDPETSETMTPLGFNPLNEYRLFAARQGYYALFAQKNEVYRSQYRHYPVPNFVELPRFASFRYLQSIIDLAMAHNARLILFTHPYHADYLDMLREVGLWESFEDWKRSLVEVIGTAARAQPGKTHLFDFACYNAFTTERVPPPGDRHTVMRWYWEAGHYKSALGNEMLETMLGRVARFGVALTAANVETTLQKIRESRSFFRQRLDRS
jgi:hypothetical protein